MYSSKQQLTAELCLAILENKHLYDTSYIDQWINESEFDVTLPTIAGYTPLFYAVLTGNWLVFDKLINKLPDQSILKKEKYDGLTLLDIAYRQISHLKKGKKNLNKIIASLTQCGLSYNFTKFTKKIRAENTAQSWLKTPLYHQGYSVSEGYCFGFSNTASQTFVLEDRDERDKLLQVKDLKKRVSYLKTSSTNNKNSETFSYNVSIARHKRIIWVELLKNKKNQEKKRKTWDPADQEWLNQKINKKLTADNKLHLELVPFFNTLEIFQNGDVYSQFGSKLQSDNVGRGATFVPSVALEKQGGMIVDSFTAKYNINKLQDFFPTLDFFTDKYDADALQTFFLSIEQFANNNDYGGFHLDLLSISNFDHFDSEYLRITSEEKPYLDLNKPCLIKDRKGKYKLWGYRDGQWQLTDLDKAIFPEAWSLLFAQNKSVYISLKDEIIKTLKQGHTRYGAPIVLQCSANTHTLMLAYDPLQMK